MQMSGRPHTLSTLPPAKESSVDLLNRRLDVSYNDSQHCTEEKNLLSLPGFEPIIIQPVVYSLYHLCCPGSMMCQNVNVHLITVMAFWSAVPLSLIILLLWCYHTSVFLLSASSLIKLLYRANFTCCFSLILLLLILHFILLASLTNLPYRYTTITFVPHFYLLYWLLLIFQNWKFTVGIGKGDWLVTLSWR